MKRNKTEISRTQEMELEQDAVDRLSSLPDSLLVSILSLLKVKQAASTSVLSHRWTHLWTQITRLKVSYDCSPRKSFVSTVDHIFNLLTSIKIHSFHLGVPYLKGNDTHLESSLGKWFGYVCAHNVEKIKVSDSARPFLNLPTCIFNCRSLVVLEYIRGFSFKLLPANGIINLPNLKKLVLHNLYDWDCQTMSTLFKSFPVLEVLDLNIQWCDDGLSMDISCQNLRSLTINVGDSVGGCNCKINAPKLEFIEVSGGVSSFLFVEKPCLLTETKIMWMKFEDVGADYLEKMSALVKGICSVQSLEVTSIPFRSLHSHGNSLPTFPNLSELYICLNEAADVKNLLRCLQCAPNLEVLYFDKCVSENGVEWGMPNPVPLCLSQKIKKIKAMRLDGSKEDLEFLKYILDNANVLKSILVGVSSRSAAEIPNEARFCKNLFTCPRSSKTCRIDFQSEYLHASSTENHSCAEAKLKCEFQI